jgi:hypothetical protein
MNILPIIVRDWTTVIIGVSGCRHGWKVTKILPESRGKTVAGNRVTSLSRACLHIDGYYITSKSLSRRNRLR